MISPYRRRQRPIDNPAAWLRSLLQSVGLAVCAGCSESFPPDAVEIDHVLPLSHGGEDTAQNLQILCVPCHRDKSRREVS